MQFIDLSVPIRNHSFDPAPQEIAYSAHSERARLNAKAFGIEVEDMGVEGRMGAQEFVSASTHAGTHVDAPYHFGPVVAGLPAKTIDEVPLDWCFGDGVVLDVSNRTTGDTLTPEDLQSGLRALDFQLQPGTILLLNTGSHRRFDRTEYATTHCGLSGDALEWLLDQGVRTIGTDAASLDTSIPSMVAALKRGDQDAFFPVHFRVGRRREHIHCEKLGNLDLLPRPFGFKVAMFPILVENASGSWARVVAMFDDD